MKQYFLKKKNILINRIMFDGEKNTSEKQILKCFKTLLKISKKQSSKIIKLFLINTTPVFKIHKSVNKKIKKKKRKIRVTPFFILKSCNRVSYGIKIMLQNLKKKENNYFFKIFVENILLNAKNENYSIETKNRIQKTALENKRYLKNFKK